MRVMSLVSARLEELGLVLPPPVSAVANYVPAIRTGKLIVISGQVCLDSSGKIPDQFKGKLGAEVSKENGIAAARLCALNVLSQLQSVIGDLDKVERCVRMGGFINATPDFGSLPQVMNGASDLMLEVFGDKGRHARSTIGAAQLPLDSAVEVEAMFEVL